MTQALHLRGDRQPRYVPYRQEYQRHLYRAEFYVWCVLRRHTGQAMRDPITGLGLASNPGEEHEISDAVHKALARVYLRKAAKFRRYAGRLP